MSRPDPKLLTLPASEPPYDEHDRRHGSASPTAGALALAHLPPRAAFAGGGRAPEERALRGLAQAVAEILAGQRPAGVVAGRFTERAYGELVRAGRMIHTPRRVLVGRPHITRPQDDVIEFCVLVHCGDRSRVLALRLERRRTHWLCTEFETAETTTSHRRPQRT
ncbi:Rv3235 family protein [Sphaerisporangium sp. B11E5]|uniref:Rv3235 family protein n=1 Tax=Sphaerisporangium sp. B11E5 TaxID=3153563 RepID=UPI00325D5597